MPLPCWMACRYGLPAPPSARASTDTVTMSPGFAAPAATLLKFATPTVRGNQREQRRTCLHQRTGLDVAFGTKPSNGARTSV